MLSSSLAAPTPVGPDSTAMRVPGPGSTSVISPVGSTEGSWVGAGSEEGAWVGGAVGSAAGLQAASVNSRVKASTSAGNFTCFMV